MSKSEGVEVICEGWLTKSPPTKTIWRARWRRRWFVLQHSGELPGQYYLSYYTDTNCRSLKGQIDLDQCEQVDAGLRFENRKQKYQHMFDVRTPKRTYYLAAETEADMNRWVDCVCHVCGLKVYNQDENSYDEYRGDEDTSSRLSLEQAPGTQYDSPPTSPTSTASGPYIPISECISGGPTLNKDDIFYDSPRRLQLPSDLDLGLPSSDTPPLQSPATDVESVFTDEEWVSPNPKPAVNWETFPRPSDSPNEDKFACTRQYKKPVAPPRPPKPRYLSVQEGDGHIYLNLEDATSCDKPNNNHNDSVYDFPRSYQIHPELEGNPVPLPRLKHNPQIGDVFRFPNVFPSDGSEEEPASPHLSDTSSTSNVVYSNLPSPANPPNPPLVNRKLKPRRKNSEATSNEPSPIPPTSAHPPDVDRKLKPVPSMKKDEEKDIKLSAPPRGRGLNAGRKVRAAPSPTPVIQDSELRHDDSEVYYPYDNYYFGTLNSARVEIQYLDLDLDSAEQTSTNPQSHYGTINHQKSPITGPQTVYKTVDFIKTEAFNRTKQKVEEERKQCADIS